MSTEKREVKFCFSDLQLYPWHSQKYTEKVLSNDFDSVFPCILSIPSAFPPTPSGIISPKVY